MGNQWDNWRNGGRPLTDPDAFDENGRPRHEYCSWCGKVTNGPHEGERWPLTPEGKPIIEAADDERTYTREEAAAAGKLHNVGSTVCPTCYTARIAAMREESRAWHAEHDKPATPETPPETAGDG